MRKFVNERQGLTHWTNPSHRVYTDIQPVVSAYTKGYRRIAIERFNALTKKLNLQFWEVHVVKDIVREAVAEKLSASAA